MIDIHSNRLLILDFGSQYTQLIARRVRETGVYSELHACDMDDQAIRDFNPKGIILSGGPESVIANNILVAPQVVFELGVPVLGICYGMQIMAAQLGGEVKNSDHREFGYAQVLVRNHSKFLIDIEDHVNEEGHSLLDVWMSHGDKVTQIPAGFNVIASSEGAPIAAMADESRAFYAVQFHPEVTHTKRGQCMIERFVHEICGCENLWITENIIKDQMMRVKQQVGSDEVILGLSGGVDSSVVAIMLHKAIGKQLTCVFVDNGMLRLNEGNKVMAMFEKNMGLKVIRVNAEKRFLDALVGQTDPEVKRKIIGNMFVNIFEEEAGKLISAKWLAQGTIYPDVVESAGAKSGKGHLIKSHHNVGGLPEDMTLKLVEPLRELFKDEVRKLGVELGLPPEMVYRHPFPGPGLGVRILGEVEKRICGFATQG